LVLRVREDAKPPDGLVLAQRMASGRDWLTIVVLSTILMALVLVLGLLVLWYRKRFVAGGGEERTEPLTLDDLRDLRARGMVSEEESERLRGMIIREAQAAAGLAEAVPQKAAESGSDNPPGTAPTGGGQEAPDASAGSSPDGPTTAQQENEPQPDA